MPTEVASHVAEALSKPIVAFDHTRTYSKGRKRVETHVERSGVSVSGMDFLAVGGALLGLSAAMWIVGVGMRPAFDEERSAAKAALEDQLSKAKADLEAARRGYDASDPRDAPYWLREIHRLEGEVARLEALLADSPLGPAFRIERRPRLTEWNLVGATTVPSPSLPQGAGENLEDVFWAIVPWGWAAKGLLGR